MSENIKKLNGSEFYRVINNNGKTVLVDFWAPWCAPCRMLSPVLSEVADQVKPNVVIGKVNVDEEPALAEEFGIRGIPNIIVFKNGKLIKQMVGMQRKEDLLAALK